MNEKSRGFTLVELLVVISIMGILASIVFVSARPASSQARDTQRQADLREVKTALQLYKNKYGRYPERCPSNHGDWSGQTGTNYECDSGNEYIVGLAPEFIPTLPRDPKLNGNDSGYVYTTNADGTVYKFMAKNTVEADEIDYNHPFKSCDLTYEFFDLPPSPDMNDYTTSCDPANPETDNRSRKYGCDIGICDRIYTTNSYGSTPDAPSAECLDGNPQFESTYAVWGGISNVTNSFFFNPGQEAGRRVHIERETEKILCLI